MSTQPQQRLVILGAGESGLGTALLGRKLGYEVFVSEYGQPKAAFAKELIDENIPHELGKHTPGLILDADIVMKSPGIPQDAPIVSELRTSGIPIVSEIEFASRHTNGKIIAITGTNGKTTTTTMTYNILRHGGLDVCMAGNIGNSFARELAQRDYAYWVLEISSFQLEDIDTFCPHIAMITNLSRNHLNRYDGSMAAYGDAKMNITRNQSPADCLLYNLDSPDLVVAVARTTSRANPIGFSMVQTDADVFFDLATSTLQFNIHFNPLEPMARKRSITKRLPIDLNVDGKHNRYNAMASATVGSLLEIRKENVRESLSEFKNADHRLEKVTTLNGRHFINDSKATNINASWFALESMNSKVVWIVGGVDKGNDYGMVLELVKKKCHTVVMLGRDAQSVERIRAAFKGHIDTLYHATSMEQAVHKSYQFAGEGDTVLLSPACASFDMFEDYEDRGNRFKRVIRTLS